MTKQRDYVRASSLGSYFGVGFNDPETQYLIDTGQMEETFDDDSQDRLDLGKFLESATLDYFENKLGILITDRNENVLSFFNDRLRGIVDGMTEYQGIKTVVENKISNSKKGRFTDNLGYIFQVQAYMMATNTDQALLCGLYMGKPIYKIIKRDEEMIEDIKTMVTFVTNVMLGFDSWTNYPKHLYEKYAKKPLLEPLTNVFDKDIEIIVKLASEREKASEINKHIKELEDLIKDKYQPGIIDLATHKVTISENVYRGGYDVESLMDDHPEIKYDQYKKPDTKYQQIRINKKKTTQ